MKAILIATVLSATSLAASADTYVRGHVRSNGTYVAPHVRSSPNNIKFDNYSAKGNTNPYTGQRGSGPSELYPSAPRDLAPAYPAPKPIGPYGR